jgi:hypothetical protein
MTAAGWVVGISHKPMKDWRAAVRTAEINRREWRTAQTRPEVSQASYDMTAYEKSTMTVPKFKKKV